MERMPVMLPPEEAKRQTLYVEENRYDFEKWERELEDVSFPAEAELGDEVDVENAVLEQAAEAGTLDFADIIDQTDSPEEFEAWSQELGIETEVDAFELEAMAEEPLPGSWPESENGVVTSEKYNQQLNYRLSCVGHWLDTVRSGISSDADAEQWLELKKAVAAARGLGTATDSGANKVTVVIELEDVAYDFVIQHN